MVENTTGITRLPSATVARIAKSIDDDIRLSQDAVTLISLKAEEFIEDAARKSLAYANHASRKTVKACDVEMVFAPVKPTAE